MLVKQTPSRFAILDAAMNDLMRPAMYDAWHGIVPVSTVRHCSMGGRSATIPMPPRGNRLRGDT
jgi:diaminopimelate decarboxylase